MSVIDDKSDLVSSKKSRRIQEVDDDDYTIKKK
jgi:hypothetical protein